MKTMFAVLSILMFSAPAMSYERGPFVRHGRVAFVRGDLARVRGYERFRFARLERDRRLHVAPCARYYY